MKQKIRYLVKHLQKNYLNCWIVLGADTLATLVCTWAAYVLVHYIVDTPIDLGLLWKTVVVAGLSGVLTGWLLRTYRSTIRFFQLKDLLRLFGCAAVKTACVAIAIGFCFDMLGWSNSQKVMFLFFDGMLTFIVLIGFRIQLILSYEYLLGIFNKRDVRILIYGIDEKSIALKIRLTHSHYKIIGFYTYGDSHSHRRITGLPVFSFSNEQSFGYLMRERCISGILFPSYGDTQKEERRLLQYCKQHGIKTFIAPDISETDAHDNLQQQIRPVRVEDLLGRSEVHINMREVMMQFQNKVVLVTGAAGSIGSELCRQLLQLKIRQLIMFDSAETPLHTVYLEFKKKYPDLDFIPIIGDVRVKERLRMVFDLYQPQVVFHAAAYKHVPLMEDNPCEAVLVNVVGSRQVADMSVEYGVKKMIMVSTDKAVNPTNVMGASKRLAEIYVQSLGYAIKEKKVRGSTEFITTRFGNVLGSNGSVIPHFRDQIESGGPVTVTHPDIIRYFMTIPEACRLVMEAATMGKGNEIFVFEMGNPVKIVDLATRMIELAGYEPGKDIKIEFTGLRPGEKLYEELLSGEENTIPTYNEKIKIARVRKYEYDEILGVYAEFERLSYKVKIIDTVRLMKQLIPEFKSKNSPRFEVLDNEQ